MRRVSSYKWVTSEAKGRLTFRAGRTEPAQLAVALFLRRSGGVHIHAAAPVSTVAVVDAFVSVLASRTVVQSVASAFAEQMPTVSAAVLLEVFP